jgi:hypothetical protein
VSKRTSTIGPQLRRYLYRAILHLETALKGLRELVDRSPDPPSSASPHRRAHADARFFFIVVEVPGENPALIRTMESNAGLPAAIQLPYGCRFRTCFEISAEYAEIVINM